MDYLWVAIAFCCGFLVKQVNLPPLVGYLIAGFGLHALGVQPADSLQTLADLGVTLLLFTIGLKLDIKSLLKTEIWVSANAHMLAIVLITTLTFLAFSFIGLNFFTGLNMTAAAMIGLALSFSSTVCVVKILEEKGELRARHGQVAIGILIIQDIAAVLFVTFATDKSPSLWAILLLALPLLKPVFNKLMDRAGHGELLPLLGFFMALTGGELFESVGLKAHLGALVIAVILSDHKKATELSKSLLDFKDIFLIGFFLSIGFTALPTLDMFVAALIIALLLPIKAGLFFLLLTKLKLRARSAFLAALSLSNFSEFALIVCSASVVYGHLAKEWLVIIALAVSISFVMTSVINAKAHPLFYRWAKFANRFESRDRLPEDKFEPVVNVSVLVIGMGRVGTGAYDTLVANGNYNICGVDVDKNRLPALRSAGRKVIAADAEDPYFWTHINLNMIQLVMLALPKHLDMIEVARQLKLANYRGKIAATAHFEDEKKMLLAEGIDVVFNFYQEAGAGFAEQSMQLLTASQTEPK